MPRSILRIRTAARTAALHFLSRLPARPRGIVHVFLHTVEDDEHEAFTVLLDALRNIGPIVPLEEAIARGALEDPTPRFSLSFDDGFASLAKNAVPILLRERVPATFFVASGFLDLRGAALREYTTIGLRRHDVGLPLGRQDVRELAKLGFTIGSHGVSHRDFSHMQESELRRELGESRELLSHLAGTRTSYFAWPFGRLSSFPPWGYAIAFNLGYTDLFSAATRRDRHRLPPHVHPRRHLEANWNPRWARYFAVRG